MTLIASGRLGAWARSARPIRGGGVVPEIGRDIQDGVQGRHLGRRRGLLAVHEPAAAWQLHVLLHPGRLKALQRDAPAHTRHSQV